MSEDEVNNVPAVIVPVDKDEWGLINAETGEVFPLSGMADDVIARLYRRMVEFRRELNFGADRVAGEVLRRMDARARWTFEAGGVKLTGESPAPREEWDTGKLGRVLRSLVKQGIIDARAASEALERDVSWKVKQSGINALRKLGDPVASAIDECRTQVPRAHRRVQVK